MEFGSLGGALGAERALGSPIGWGFYEVLVVSVDSWGSPWVPGWGLGFLGDLHGFLDASVDFQWYFGVPGHVLMFSVGVFWFPLGFGGSSGSFEISGGLHGFLGISMGS